MKNIEAKAGGRGTYHSFLQEQDISPVNQSTDPIMDVDVESRVLGRRGRPQQSFLGGVYQLVVFCLVIERRVDGHPLWRMRGSLYARPQYRSQVIPFVLSRLLRRELTPLLSWPVQSQARQATHST